MNKAHSKFSTLFIKHKLSLCFLLAFGNSYSADHKCIDEKNSQNSFGSLVVNCKKITDQYESNVALDIFNVDEIRQEISAKVDLIDQDIDKFDRAEQNINFLSDDSEVKGNFALRHSSGSIRAVNQAAGSLSNATQSLNAVK